MRKGVEAVEFACMFWNFERSFWYPRKFAINIVASTLPVVEAQPTVQLFFISIALPLFLFI